MTAANPSVNSGRGKPVRVRFPPSPTGHPHLGMARAMLFNWLFARQHGGKIVFRIEDTDAERSKPEFEREIIDVLTWLGIDWDEGLHKEGSPHGPYRQSERVDIYRPYLEQLLKERKAYWCYCTKEELEAQRVSLEVAGLAPKYTGHCRNLESPPSDKAPQVIRLVVPEKKITFTDLIRGSVTFDLTLFGDFVIAKNTSTPLYNLAVVIDDHQMEITHVIRGEEHISNTPKQILLQEALGFETPIYAHTPLVLSADKKKLSKRYAETSIIEYQKDGYLPEALVNFLILLGWHPTDDQEIFTKEELIEKFDLSRVQKAGAVFNPEKLLWLNAQHIKRTPIEILYDLLLPFLKEAGIEAKKDFVMRIIETERERMKTLADFVRETEFFFTLREYESSLLVWDKQSSEEIGVILRACFETLSQIDWQIPTLRDTLDTLAVQYGKGGVFWPLRVALSGKAASPDPISIMSVLGKEEGMRRVNIALQKLNA